MARWERLNTWGIRSGDFVENGAGIDFTGSAVDLAQHFKTRLCPVIDAHTWVSHDAVDTFQGRYQEVVVLQIYDDQFLYVAAPNEHA